MSEGMLNFLPWLVPVVCIGLPVLIWIGKLIAYLCRGGEPKPKTPPRRDIRSGDVIVGYVRRDK